MRKPSGFILLLVVCVLKASRLSAFLLASARSQRGALSSLDGRATQQRQQRHGKVPMSMLPESTMFLLSDAVEPSSSVMQLSKETTIVVFVVGVIPFAIATVEFWRRIAVGASFGTNDPVVFIGEDDAPSSSRGKQVLGKDSLITAYIIFTVVIAVLGLVLFSVLTSPDPDLARNALISTT